MVRDVNRKETLTNKQIIWFWLIWLVLSSETVGPWYLVCHVSQKSLSNNVRLDVRYSDDFKRPNISHSLVPSLFSRLRSIRSIWAPLWAVRN